MDWCRKQQYWKVLLHYWDLKNCLSYYQNFINISREIKDHLGIAVGLLNITEVYFDLGTYSSAMEELNSALEILEENKIEIYLSQGYLLKGVIHILTKNYYQAEKALVLAKELYRDEDKPYKVMIYLNINKILRILSGYKRYKTSLASLVVEVYEDLEGYLEVEIEKDESLKVLEFFYGVIENGGLDSLDLEYAISLAMMRKAMKGKLVDLYSELYGRSKREKYLLKLKQFS